MHNNHYKLSLLICTECGVVAPFGVGSEDRLTHYLSRLCDDCGKIKYKTYLLENLTRAQASGTSSKEVLEGINNELGIQFDWNKIFSTTRYNRTKPSRITHYWNCFIDITLARAFFITENDIDWWIQN